MKKFIMFSIMLISLAFVVTSCDEPTTNDVLADKQEKLMSEANRQLGMPNITKFTQRKQLKWIQELCDNENLVCYAYIVPELTGKPVFLTKCIGYGLPFSTEYTNPQKLEYHSTGGYCTLPQADPNGLFMPSSAEGTWIIAINPKTKEIHPIYCEPRVLISPYPLNPSDGDNVQSISK